MRGLSLVVASRVHSSSRCAGLSLSRPLLLRSTGSRHEGSVVVAHGPSCSVACGISPGQGSNPCPLHWQADSQPLRHQGSPQNFKSLCLSWNIHLLLPWTLAFLVPRPSDLDWASHHWPFDSQAFGIQLGLTPLVPLVLRPLDSDHIPPLAFLVLHFADGRL